jgi:thiol-disulfide isomerase/thioredoxin
MKTLLALVLAWPLAAAATDSPELAAALSDAAARKVPVMIDFHAPWCYSCYFMARHVLTGPEFEALKKKVVVLEVDADSPDGDALKTRLQVKALPSYVVVDSSAKELGRILAEQTRAEFYARMNEILKRGATLDSLAAGVTDGGAKSVTAAREVLKSYHARYDADGGLAWLASLPEGARTAILKDSRGALWKRRLEFMQAAQKKDAPACAAIGADVLAGDLGCDRAYELDRLMECSDGVPERKALLTAQAPAMKKLFETGAFGKSRCADVRSVVFTTADLDEAIGDSAGEKAVLDRAIADTQKRLGKDLRSDRNLADNLRVLLDRAGRTAELDALYVKLIDAYPDDYVYAYRHGKSLMARGDAAGALPFLDRAAEKAYGANRLKVAEQRVLALKALKRDDDAKRVVAEALKANGPWFPEDAAKLKSMVM